MWSLERIKLSKFNYLINKVICQSKNIPISQKLIENIINRFENDIILKYTSGDLQKFGINALSYQLYVYIVDIDNIQNIFQKYPLKYQKQQLQSIRFGLTYNHAIYCPTVGNSGVLILNYQALVKEKDNIQFFKSIIAHQLTHYFEVNQKCNIKKWYQIFSNKEQFTVLQQKAIIMLYRKYRVDIQDIQYLANANQFQSFCTSIQKNKNKLDKNILENIVKSVFNLQILKCPIYLRNLYLFIFVNYIFDQVGQRIKYIRQHF